MSTNVTRFALCTLHFALCITLISCKPVNPIEDNDLPTQDTVPTVDTLPQPCAETQLAYLSIYPTPEQLVAEGDDDEASAWLWFHRTYPEGRYLYFGDIHTAADMDSLQVLFWLRDIESGNVKDVLTMPDVVTKAAPVLTEWYRQGGNIVLWGHAVLFAETLGRLPEGTYTAPEHDFGCECGTGFLNQDHWFLSVQLYPGGTFKKDHSTHPLFRNIHIFSNNDIRGFMVKGPGWTENHNCIFYNYPSELTGRSWQQEICYTLLTEYFGIYPLAVWDSQIHWVSQLNIYELRQGQTDYQGRILCIGNGGCEFSMKGYRQVGTNDKGEPLFETIDDRTACPTNNIYQTNILLMANNAIEYMRHCYAKLIIEN